MSKRQLSALGLALSVLGAVLFLLAEPKVSAGNSLPSQLTMGFASLVNEGSADQMAGELSMWTTIRTGAEIAVVIGVVLLFVAAVFRQDSKPE